METKDFTLINKTLIRCLLVLVTLFGGGNFVWGDELTINDSESRYSYGIPFNAKLLTTDGHFGEFIVSSTQLSAMSGKNITAIKFYAKKNPNFGTATFSVCMKEVTESEYTTTGALGGTGTTTVYSGSLEITGTSDPYEMFIPLSNVFSYSGDKNLLVRINVTNTTGTNSSSELNFYGKSASSGIPYTSYGTRTVTTRLMYQPKVTFTYETPVSNSISASPNENAAFGDVYENANKVYRITNNGSSAVSVTPSITGTNASEFSVSPSEATSIAAGGYQDFTFSFNYDSSSLGAKEATLTFTPSDNEYNTLQFSATATAIDNNAPELSVTPNEDATFGSVRANATKTYTITNAGTGTLTVNIASDNATEFSVSKSSATLGAGESTTFDVAFSFSTERSGNRSANITVIPTYNEGAAVNITATATAITQPVLGVNPSSASFGSLKVNGTREITVSNTGYGPMTVNISSSNETLFSVSPSSLTVAQDESKTFTITFNYDPSSLGYKSESVYVTPTYNESDKITISATATALEPMFVSPTSATAFGNVTGNASRTFTVTNLGVSPMSITIENNNETDFTLSTTSIEAIPARESRTFTVTFKHGASTTGSTKTAQITVVPNNASTGKTFLNINATPQSSSYMGEGDVTLNESESSSLSVISGKKVKLLYTAQSGWNTICVPFGLNPTTLSYIFGSECKAYQLENYNSSTGQLTFSSFISYPAAAKPYIVFTESAPTYADGTILTGITISNLNITAGSTTKNSATFQGTYAPITAGNFTTSMYGVTSAGQVRPGDGLNANMKGYRAYFTGVSAPAGSRLSIVFDDDGETTDLGFVKMVDENAKDVYTLSGQKVQKGGKGIYVVNGRKVIIK